MMPTLALVFLDPALIHAEWHAAAWDSKAKITETKCPLPGAHLLLWA